MKSIASYGIAITITLLLVFNADCYAQGPPGGGPGPCTNPPCNPPNPPGLAPIDEGVLFLLVSGLALGVMSLKRDRIVFAEEVSL